MTMDHMKGLMTVLTLLATKLATQAARRRYRGTHKTRSTLEGREGSILFFIPSVTPMTRFRLAVAPHPSLCFCKKCWIL